MSFKDFQPDLFIQDSFPPEVGLVKKGYVIPNDEGKYGCFYSLKDREPIGLGGNCDFSAAFMDTTKEAVQTAIRVNDRMECVYSNRHDHPNTATMVFSIDNWRDYKEANRAERNQKPTRIYVTVVPNRAVKGQPENDTPYCALYFLSCKSVSTAKPWEPKESFFWNQGDGDYCQWSDCNRDISCEGLGSEFIVSDKFSRLKSETGEAFCFVGNRHLCCKRKGIRTQAVPELKNKEVDPTKCYSFVVDTDLGAAASYCMVPLHSDVCEIEQVTQVVPTTCFPSNQQYGSEGQAECSKFLETQITKDQRDLLYTNLCSYYPTLIACSCIRIEDDRDFRELQSHPNLMGAHKGCFWRQCQDTIGAVFVTEDDKQESCETINCSPYVDLEGLSQNIIEGIDQSVICNINKGGDGDDDSDIDSSGPPAVTGPSDSTKTPTGSPAGPSFGSGEDILNSAYEEGGSFLSEYWMYIGAAVVVLIMVFAGIVFMYMSSSSSTATKGKAPLKPKPKSK